MAPKKPMTFKQAQGGPKSGMSPLRIVLAVALFIIGIIIGLIVKRKHALDALSHQQHVAADDAKAGAAGGDDAVPDPLRQRQHGAHKSVRHIRPPQGGHRQPVTAKVFAEKQAVDDGPEEPPTPKGRRVVGTKPQHATGGRAQVVVRRDPDAQGGDGAHRGITCPPYNTAIDSLQIPLKHLPRKIPTSVAQKYDRRANNCASNGIWNRVRIEDHHKILHHMVRLGHIAKGSFVLDWGAGCGHSLQFLADEYGVNGVGIDVSNRTIAYATANTTKDNLYCVADGTKLEWLPTSSFDHAISFGSIYHVYNRTMFCHVLRQLVRVVKIGGTIYNGWTENAEYKRQHVAMCLADLDVSFKIHEEKVEFADVKVFPLKAQQVEPNSYSLVISKKGQAADEKVFELENIPIECGVHRCDKRGSGVALEDTPKPAKGKPTRVAQHSLKKTAPPATTTEAPVEEATTTEAPTEEATTTAAAKRPTKRGRRTAAPAEDADAGGAADSTTTAAAVNADDGEETKKAKATTILTIPGDMVAEEDTTTAAAPKKAKKAGGKKHPKKTHAEDDDGAAATTTEAAKEDAAADAGEDAATTTKAAKKAAKTAKKKRVVHAEDADADADGAKPKADGDDETTAAAKKKKGKLRKVHPE